VRSFTLRVPACAGTSVLRSDSYARHRRYSTRGAPLDPGGVSMVTLHIGWRHDQEEAPSPPVTLS